MLVPFGAFTYVSWQVTLHVTLRSSEMGFL